MILAYIADVSERVNIRRTIHEAKSTCRLKSKNNVFLIKVYFSMKVKYLKVMYENFRESVHALTVQC